MSCSDLKDFAFNSHPKCYVESGFYELPKINWVASFVRVGGAFIHKAGGTFINSGGTYKLCKERKESYGALFDEVAETITAY